MTSPNSLPSAREILFPSPPKLSIQSVLYNNSPDTVLKSILSIGRATDIAIYNGVISSVDLCYGDCSDTPIFFDHRLSDYIAKHAPHIRLVYAPFGKNLGSACGHNELMPLSDGGVVLIQNPDVLPAPDTYCELMSRFRQPGVGMVEARQIPIEHPKDYSANGETSWAATACAMIPRSIMAALNGFDANSFFLYCDDVDFSWRVRLAGFKVIFQASAVIFHDKTLTAEGKWRPTNAEVYYSAEASLMMAHKWSKPKRVLKLLENFSKSGDANLIKAAQIFKLRQENGTLSAPLDVANEIGIFTDDGNYAPHRFTL